MEIHKRFAGSGVISVELAVRMWTLTSNMAAEWMPRTCLRTHEKLAETDADDQMIGFRGRRPTPLMQLLLDALAPFAGARSAVAEALRQFALPLPGWIAVKLQQAIGALDPVWFAAERLGFHADLKQRQLLESEAKRVMR